MEETHRSFAHISGGQNSVVYRLSYRTPIISTAVTIDVRYDTCLGIICELRIESPGVYCLINTLHVQETIILFIIPYKSLVVHV